MVNPTSKIKSTEGTASGSNLSCRRSCIALASGGVFLAFLLPLSAIANKAGIELHSPANKQLDGTPGHIVTASVLVSDHGDGGEMIDTLVLPAGCARIAPIDLPFNLASGGQAVRVIAVLLPANIASGQFVMRYGVRSRRDPSSSDSIDFVLNVASIDKLELVVEPNSNPVLAGDSYPIKLSVTNHGNASLSAQLSAKSSLNFPVSIQPAAFSLAPGAVREFVAAVQTSKLYTRHTTHAVTFDVTATSISGKNLAASQASVAEIIPLVSGDKAKTFHVLPVQTRMIGIAETHRGGQLQGEISGEGSLDEEGKHLISFLFRGPDVQSASLFGERDEYGIGYRGEHLDVDIGDRVYALTPLLEKGSLGRGAGIGWHEEGMAAGLFTMSSRYRQHNIEETGIFLRQDVTQQLSVQASFLRKSGEEAATPWKLPQDIVSLEARYSVGKALDLRVESGFSRSDSGVEDNAYRIEARGTLPGSLTYVIEHTHAGPNFDGYYSGNDLTYLSLGKDFTKQFRAHLSYNRYNGNPALNDIRSTVVNSENSWNAGVTYALTKERNTELSFDLNHIQREDILLPAAYKFTEDSVRFGIGQNLGRINAQVFVDTGNLNDSLNGKDGSFVRYGGVLSWRPTDSQTYAVFANYGPSPFTGAMDKSLSAGVSARWQVNDKLSAVMSYSRNQFDGLTGTQQDQAMVSVRHEFHNKSSLALVGRWVHGVVTGSNASGSNAIDDTAVMLTYTVPLSVPVSRNTSMGGLEGRLFDSTPGTGHNGLARAVIQVGEQYAATDGNGHFSFPILKPGYHQLLVMPDSLGPRFAMVTPLPLQVNIVSAKTSWIDLKATAAASITVTVRRYEFADGNSMSTTGTLKSVGGQEGVYVEIENGHDTWRAQTDRLGLATFDRLAIGGWRLKLAGVDLPPLSQLENPTRSLTLEPGKNLEVFAKVVPQKRTFKLLDQGTVR